MIDFMIIRLPDPEACLDRSNERGLFGGRFFFRSHDNAAHVISAARADDMSWNSRRALGARRQRPAGQCVMGSAAAGSSVGVLALWNGHQTESLYVGW